VAPSSQVPDDGSHECDECCSEAKPVRTRTAVRPLQRDFLEYLPVVLQDATTKDVLMVQYMTEEGLRRTLEERSMWLWSRSREKYWMSGRQSNGYELKELRANCMGDSLPAIIDREDRAVCHLGHPSCFR
jgi:phosphoribosyl-AMP cyclohydrolase